MYKKLDRFQYCNLKPKYGQLLVPFLFYADTYLWIYYKNVIDYISNDDYIQ